jgi:hypothetical protein
MDDDPLRACRRNLLLDRVADFLLLLIDAPNTWSIAV